MKYYDGPYYCYIEVWYLERSTGESFAEFRWAEFVNIQPSNFFYFKDGVLNLV